MSTLPEIATVTVSSPVDGTTKRKTRSDKGAKRGARSPIVRTLVDPRVWSAALAAASGQVDRIQVHSPTEVVVHNHPWKKGSTS